MHLVPDASAIRTPTRYKEGTRALPVSSFTVGGRDKVGSYKKRAVAGSLIGG